MSEENPFEALKKIFHEPKRLAIMSALCATDAGMTFKQLKENCDLTDGNLNRHLKVLGEAKAIKIKKKFVGAKPQTSAHLTESGFNQFNEYLVALSQVLEHAKRSVSAPESSDEAEAVDVAEPGIIPEEGDAGWKSYGVYL